MDLPVLAGVSGGSGGGSGGGGGGSGGGARVDPSALKYLQRLTDRKPLAMARLFRRVESGTPCHNVSAIECRRVPSSATQYLTKCHSVAAQHLISANIDDPRDGPLICPRGR